MWVLSRLLDMFALKKPCCNQVTTNGKELTLVGLNKVKFDINIRLGIDRSRHTKMGKLSRLLDMFVQEYD
jgi:hypothetical protein